VSHDLLALTTYFGERDTADGRLLGDALMAVYARRRLRTSVLLRGTSGFGVKHHLRTDRLLTLSEDLALVAFAVDRPDAILAAAEETAARAGDGLITLERASGNPVATAAGEEVKVTVFLGRGGRTHVRLVDRLRRHGVAGASVLAGVDGTLDGRRRRARLLGTSRGAPVVVVAVGAAERIAAALGGLAPPARTFERVRVCKRDGARLAAPHDDLAPAEWRKLTVICGSQSRHGDRPLPDALIRGLREAGAAGATALRGIWGFHGDHTPHGDTLRQVRRRVPVVVTTVDEHARSRRAYEVIDQLTGADGLVLSERVPAFRASGPGIALGRLRLAMPSDPP
jgi:PII-like signaling protein